MRAWYASSVGPQQAARAQHQPDGVFDLSFADFVPSAAWPRDN